MDSSLENVHDGENGLDWNLVLCSWISRETDRSLHPGRKNHRLGDFLCFPDQASLSCPSDLISEPGDRRLFGPGMGLSTYTKVVAVKKLVVGFLVVDTGRPLTGIVPGSAAILEESASGIKLSGVVSSSFTVSKIECSKQA